MSAAPITFVDVATHSQARIVQQAHNPAIKHLATDSRTAQIGPHTLFFAIKGPRHNGHSYLPALYQKGVRNFVVSHYQQEWAQQWPQANILQCPNVVLALQHLAAWHRAQFKVPVVGVTGSNGKTIVKEWLSAMLLPYKKVVKSPKSYNSQIGVPLSVWGLEPEHETGVFEAGISERHEMAALQRIMAPTLGIFTNLGTAHSEGFESQAQKAAEKALLFSQSQTVVYSTAYKEVETALLAAVPQGCTLLSWQFEKGQPPAKAPAGVQQVHHQVHIAPAAHGGVTAQVQQGQHSQPYHLPFTDHASIENTLHCIITARHLGLSVQQVQKGIESLPTLAMRLSVKQGKQQCLLIDDTYNNDLAGLEVALGFMQQHLQPGMTQTVVLSDIAQAGQSPESLYARVAQLLQAYQVQRVVGIGPEMVAHQQAFNMPGTFYNSTQAFLQNHKALAAFANELVLVKGARHFGFERIVQALQEKNHRTVLEINLEALTHNLNFYRDHMGPGTKLMVMVKAFAYGSGSVPVARLLQYQQAHYLAVAYTDEGVTLRKEGITLPIMVMNPSPESLPDLLAYGLEPEVYSLAILKALFEGPRQPAAIHLKLDTGMHRLGFTQQDLPALLQMLKAHPQVQVKSMFSHLAGADSSEHNDYSKQQAALFVQMCQTIEQALGQKPLRHLVNSAGILRFPEYHFDMVRLGIGLYGVESNQLYPEALRPISTLKTFVSQIKTVEKGQTVGYGRKGVARQRTQVATIAIGYADGFSRLLSNGVGHVLIKGQKAPVLGNVCMDMTMLDVSGLDVEEGDEVIVFGPGLPIAQLASWMQTIPYEVLTSIGERVKRIFFTE